MEESKIDIRQIWSGKVLLVAPCLIKDGKVCANLVGADLNNIDLSGAFLKSAILENADLAGTNLTGSVLADASLKNSVLSQTNLTEANLERADLSFASLDEANLSRSRLTYANLRDAELSFANLSGAVLTEANFTFARLYYTTIANCPSLIQAKGVEEIGHFGASCIDATTLRTCIHKLPDVFLKGCGYTQHEIDYLRALYRDSPIAMYSCFISHAEADLPFASRLLADLRQANVTCWHYKDSLRGGRDWQPQIDEAIKVHDKLILVCSRQSVYRENVVKEILRAIDVERQTGEQKLFPIRLDDHILSSDMMEEAREMVRTERWRENWVLHIKRKHIPDFSGWDKDNAKYTSELKNLLRDLRQATAL